MGYGGPLTNVVKVATEEGATGIYTETALSLAPSLQVVKQAEPDVVQAGEQLTYTIRVTNTGNVDLHATITDVLPHHVTTTYPLVWTPIIAAPGGVWEETVVVTVATGYTGALTNKVEVTTEEGAAGTASVTVCSALVKSSTGIITAMGRYLERDGAPFEIRGMNYYPKDYAWDRFWISYTAAITQINTELDLARALGVNTVRLFVQYDLFDGSRQTYLDHLEDFVDRLQARDMAAVVTLFDLYSSPPYTDYLASKRHISTVISTLGPANPTVMAWDVKNEPDRDYARYGEDNVKDWLKEMISYTRELDPNHLVTMGV
jgi:uncharacterized repeat protein (TIGR01451 family)